MDTASRAAAETVRTAIWRARTTQTAVAAAISMSSTTWRRRISGKSSFSLSNLVAIAGALKIDPVQLVNEVMERALQLDDDEAMEQAS
ncbi:helix-turn-helix domain-containing protein [Nocardia sp. NPDC059246]|uniref:helix-turn-helix domain-containing protein n=1 Tax=unclassified Nocardia TaxID=2637762 RepID=UPI00367C35CA